MKKILINLVHPNIEKSIVNKALENEIINLNNVTVNNLYKKYPDFKIDVKKEQELLLENDVIVFQFPMYWFSSPALLKQWFDVVFDYDFAYGNYYKLENKIFAVVITTGSGEKEYCSTGFDEHTVQEFLLPFQGTAKYSKMIYKQPFITYSTFTLTNDELIETAKNYVNYIKQL